MQAKSVVDMNWKMSSDGLVSKWSFMDAIKSLVKSVNGSSLNSHGMPVCTGVKGSKYGQFERSVVGFHSNAGVGPVYGGVGYIDVDMDAIDVLMRGSIGVECKGTSLLVDFRAFLHSSFLISSITDSMP